MNICTKNLQSGVLKFQQFYLQKYVNSPLGKCRAMTKISTLNINDNQPHSIKSKQTTKFEEYINEVYYLKPKEKWVITLSPIAEEYEDKEFESSRTLSPIPEQDEDEEIEFSLQSLEDSFAYLEKDRISHFSTPKSTKNVSLKEKMILEDSPSKQMCSMQKTSSLRSLKELKKLASPKQMYSVTPLRDCTNITYPKKFPHGRFVRTRRGICLRPVMIDFQAPIIEECETDNEYEVITNRVQFEPYDPKKIPKLSIREMLEQADGEKRRRLLSDIFKILRK